MRVVLARSLWAFSRCAGGAPGTTAASFTTTATTAQRRQPPAAPRPDDRRHRRRQRHRRRAPSRRPRGCILNAVRPERVADFEKLIGYLQAALATSTDTTVRAQAEGWRVFKASEPGPNGVVLYVFVFDPAVAGADYGLGRILAARLSGSSEAAGNLEAVHRLAGDWRKPAEPDAGQGPRAARPASSGSASAGRSRSSPPLHHTLEFQIQSRRSSRCTVSSIGEPRSENTR